MDMLDIYIIFFKASSFFGIIPYELDRKELKVKRITKGFPHYFFFFNLGFCIFSLFKHSIIIYAVLMNPNYQMVELLLQVAYWDGCVMVSLILLNNHWYSKNIASLITMLLRLDKEIGELSGATEEKRKTYLKIRRLWSHLLRAGWSAGLFTATLTYFLFPRLPIFINLITPLEDETDGEWWNSLPVRIFIGLPEMYLFPIGWSILLSFDILIGTISSQIGYYLRIVHASDLSNHEEVRFFKKLQLLLINFNAAFANGMVSHMVFITCLSLCFIFGAIRNTHNIFLFLFFFMNGFLLTVRLILLLMPLATLEAVSVSVIHDFRVRPDEENVKASKREVISVSNMKVSSGGFYKIDYDSIFHYLNFLISYIIVISE